jgi:hypothetical protein
MKADKLSIRLVPRFDEFGKKFYIGRLQFPGTINLENGAVFLVFTSEEGNEELQVAIDDKKRKKDE